MKLAQLMARTLAREASAAFVGLASAAFLLAVIWALLVIATAFQ